MHSPQDDSIVIFRLREDNDILRERIRQLEEALAPTTDFSPIAHFSRAQTSVLSTIYHRTSATYEQLYQSLYSNYHDDEVPNSRIINVFIHHIRKKLVPFDIHILNNHGIGFSIPPESKSRIHAFLTGATLPCPEPAHIVEPT